MAFIDWNGNDGSEGNVVEEMLRDFCEYNWDDTSNERSYKSEEVGGITPDDIELIVAFYEYENYSGEAFVVYRDRRDNKIYQVTGGHCSCYGLEGQWGADELSIKELLARPEFVFIYSGYGDVCQQRNDAIRAALQEALV